MAKDMMKDTMETAVAKAKSAVSPIREDLDTLKRDTEVVYDDLRVLGRDVKSESTKQYYAAKDAATERARDTWETAKERGNDQWAVLSSFVQSNPGQSLAIAFVGGIIANMLMGRRDR